MLYILNKSPFEKNSVRGALAFAAAGKGHALLLVEDAVYAATKGSELEADLRKAMPDVAVYALTPDLEARGMHERVLDGVKTVDYGGFVDLVAQSPNVQSWL